MIVVRNVTLSAEETLIQRARDKAQREKTTLNEQFRLWLIRYVQKEVPAKEYESLMQDLSYARAGRHFSRDDLNER